VKARFWSNESDRMTGHKVNRTVSFSVVLGPEKSKVGCAVAYFASRVSMKSRTVTNGVCGAVAERITGVVSVRIRRFVPEPTAQESRRSSPLRLC
jgi:hypothetical protein